jgi:uncharacterized protein YgiB involved in biofilm formation
VIQWWHYCIATAVAALAIWMLAGCSHAASDLATRQRSIQDCILSGGYARLGPGDTILCD